MNPQARKYAMLLLGAILTALLLAGGCATVETSDRESELPWNTPQSWEGAPFFPGLNGQ